MDETKKCGVCHVVKSANDFYKNNRRVNGRQNTCKTCQDAKCKRDREAKKAARAVTNVEREGTKRCGRCKLFKPMEMFHNETRNSDKKQGACKDCQFIQQKERRAADPDFYIKAQAKRYELDRSSTKRQLNALLHAARNRATAKKYEYDLDLPWLLNLHEKQRGLCLLTGLELEFSPDAFGSRLHRPFAASLDRVDNSKGYTKANVRLVCVSVNLGLNRFGEEVFAKVCEAFLATRAGVLRTTPARTPIVSRPSEASGVTAPLRES